MDIAKVLRVEIAQVARQELRAEAQALKKSSAQYRREIASLKRRLKALEDVAGKLAKGAPDKPQNKRSTSVADETSSSRFSAKGLAAQRRRLGLSTAELASLLGVSGQSVYHWERGKSRPRAVQMPAISAIRTMGKREAAYRLSVIQG
jgi:DNA-binding transcriptional regulator YiaG